MVTTSPDNLWSPDLGTGFVPTTDLAHMQDTVQAALTARPLTYRIGTDAERLALSGGSLFEGLKFYATDTNIEWFYDSGWSRVDSGWNNIGTFGVGWSATATYEPRVRRSGKEVFIEGAVTFGTSGAFANILTIPTGFRPTNRRVFVNSVSTSSAALISLNLGLDGILQGVYGSGTTPVGMILPLTGSWFVD